MFYAKEQGDTLHWIPLEFRMYSTAFLPSTLSYQKRACVALLCGVQSPCWPGCRGKRPSRSPRLRGHGKRQVRQPGPAFCEICAHGAATVLPYKNYQAGNLHHINITRCYALLKDNKQWPTLLKMMSKLDQMNPSETLQNFTENNSHSLFPSVLYGIYLEFLFFL